MNNLLLDLPIELLTPLLEQFVKNEDLVSLANLARTCRQLRDSIKPLLWYIRKYVKDRHAALFVRNRRGRTNDLRHAICFIYKPDFSDYPITITNIRQYRNFFVKPTPLRRIHNSTPCQRISAWWNDLSSDNVDGFVDYYLRAQRGQLKFKEYTRCILFQNHRVVGWTSWHEGLESPSMLYFCDPPVYTSSELDFAAHVCPNRDNVALIFVENHYGEHNIHRHYYTKHNVILFKIKKNQVITFV